MNWLPGLFLLVFHWTWTSKETRMTITSMYGTFHRLSVHLVNFYCISIDYEILRRPTWQLRIFVGHFCPVNFYWISIDYGLLKKPTWQLKIFVGHFCPVNFYWIFTDYGCLRRPTYMTTMHICRSFHELS